MSVADSERVERELPARGLHRGDVAELGRLQSDATRRAVMSTVERTRGGEPMASASLVELDRMRRGLHSGR